MPFADVEWCLLLFVEQMAPSARECGREWPSQLYL